MRLGVGQAQLVDVRDVLQDGAVVGALAERDDRPGHDVHEPPDELAEDGRLPLARHLPGDAARHLRDAVELADAVIAARELRMAEVEEHEVALPAGEPTGVPNAAQEVSVALRVEHHHGLAAPDVLVHRQLQQPRLAHLRGAEHQRVPGAVLERQVHVALVRLHAVQPGRAADRRRLAEGVAGHVRREQPTEPREPAALRGGGAGVRPARQPARLDEAAELVAPAVVQALRVTLAPAEAAANEEPVAPHRNAPRTHRPAPAAAQVALVAHHAQSAADPPAAVQAERRARAVAGAGRHHEVLGAERRRGAAEQRHRPRVQFGGRTQQRLHGMPAAHGDGSATTRREGTPHAHAGAFNRQGHATRSMWGPPAIARPASWTIAKPTAEAAAPIPAAAASQSTATDRDARGATAFIRPGTNRGPRAAARPQATRQPGRRRRG